MTSPFRLWIFAFVEYKMFDHVILALICFNTVRMSRPQGSIVYSFFPWLPALNPGMRLSAVQTSSFILRSIKNSLPSCGSVLRLSLIHI